MQNIWKFVRRRLAQVVTLMALVGLIQGVGHAQTLAVSPGLSSVVAGDPASLVASSTTVPSPATYVGPASGLVPFKAGFFGTASDKNGNLYISEPLGNIVRVIASGLGPIPVLPSVPTPQAGYVYTVAGLGVNSSGTVVTALPTSCTSVAIDVGGDGCLATQATFKNGEAYGLALDSKGNLYISDPLAGIIRVVYGGTGNIPGLPGLTSSNAGYIYAVAGTYGAATTAASADGVLAIGATIDEAGYIAVDGNGSLYFYDISKKVLRAVANGPLPNNQTPTTGAVYTIVGSTGTVTDGVSASMSKINTADAIAVDSSGNIYIADTGVSKLRVVYVGGSVPGLTALTPGYIYAVAGGGSTAPLFFTPALASSVQIKPVGVAVDSAGELYIADSQNKRVMRVDLSGNLTVVYGKATDVQSYTCVSGVDTAIDGCATNANTFNGTATSFTPAGLAVDPQGNLYVVDSGLLVLHGSNVSTSSLYFTPATTQPVILYNTASPDPTGHNATDLKITGFSASSSFTVTPLSGTPPAGISADCSSAPITLAPGESCEAQISYTAGSSTATGILTVTSNSTNGVDGTTTIQLTGESEADAAKGQAKLLWSGTLPANSVAAGQQENFTFQLSCSPTCPSTGPFPTGTLTLYSGSTQIGSAQPVNMTSGGATLFTFGPLLLPTGSNLVYAVYGGDNNFVPSRSPQAAVVVNGTASTTTLPQFTAPAATGSTVSLSAIVSLANGATPPTGESAPTGNVIFKTGSTVLCTASVGASCTFTASTAAGTYPITAIYSGDNYFNTSTSTTQTLTVSAPVTTATAVSASSIAPAAGAPVTLTATVSATSGTAAPTGSVTFSINGSAQSPLMLTPASANTATAQLIVSNLVKGPNTITASYGGSTDGLFQTSQTITSTTVTVGLPATTTTVTALPASITYGQPVTLSVSVAAQVGNTVPTGNVTFTVGSTNLGTATLTGGTATLTTTATSVLPGGAGTISDTVTATYSDPTIAFASSTGTTSVSVTPLTTNTALSYSPLSPASGQTVTLVATVSAGSGNPTPNGGTVTFYNNGTQISTAALISGIAQLPTTFSSPGTEAITATFAGGGGFAGSSTSTATSIVVSAAPTATGTTLMASTTAASTGQSVTFTALVTATGTGTGTPGGLVTFQAGTSPLGTGQLDATGKATLTTSFMNAGPYAVEAIYQGNNSYNGSTSSSVTVTVAKALTASTITLTASSTAVAQGQNVTFTATVGPNSPITPTGTVSFMSGSTTLGAGTLAGGIATYSTAALAPGNYSVTAVYPGDANFSGSNSNAVALAVATPTPSFTLSATPTNLTLTSGQTGAAIITLVPTYGYTGTVALSCGTLPPNVTCSFSPASLTADGKNDTVQSTLTITTTGAATATASVAHPYGAGRNGSMRSLAFLFVPSGLLLWGVASRRKRFAWTLPLLMLGLLTAGLVGISGCGGGNGGSSMNAATGTSQITVTAAGSAGSQMQTVNLNITIQ